MKNDLLIVWFNHFLNSNVEFCLMFSSFLGNVVSRKNAFEIYWPLACANSRNVSTKNPRLSFGNQSTSQIDLCSTVPPVMSARLWNLPKNQHAQRKFFLKQFYDELWFVKNCQNCTFKVNFLCQKSTKKIQKKKSFKNINLGDQFL